MGRKSQQEVGIVFTDVDGTLVGDDHHPIPKSAETMREVAGRVPVCLVSARSPEGLYPIQEQLGFSGPLACYSGAYVLDHEGTELYSATMPTQDAVAIKEFVRRELPGLTVAAYGFHDWLVDDRSDPNVRREEISVQARARECSDLVGTFAGRGVHKLLLMGDSRLVREAERQVAARFPQLNVVRSSDILCEVMSADASKSHAVVVLCERYGVDPARAVAFGDGPNDMDMLSAVDESWAMLNGEPQVRESATHVTEWTNAECGVARTLARLVLGRRD